MTLRPTFHRSLLVFLCALPVLHAQWNPLGPVTGVSADGPFSIVASTRSHRSISISFLAPGVVRITVRRTQDPVVPTAGVERIVWPGERVALSRQGGFDIARTPSTVVKVDRATARVTIEDTTGRVIVADDLKGVVFDGREFRVHKVMPPDEVYAGLGEKSGSVMRRDRAFAMWNSDIPAYGAETDPLYMSVPFFMGIRGGRAYGIYLDNTSWTSFDLGKESPDRYSFGARGGELDYYVFLGPSPRDVVTRFTELTGRIPLPPLWSLGYQQCRWSYYPDSRVREIARTFRQKKIPCDVLYLDIDYMEGYRIFTWSQKNFPDPKGLISDLRQDGFRVATIVDPGIKADSTYHAFRSGLMRDAFLKKPDGSLFLGKVWPGVCAFPDFSKPDARAWWGEQFHFLTRVGVRGFWNDMNEPSVFDVPTKTIDLDVRHTADGRGGTHAEFHNVYGLQMTHATWDGVRTLLGDERPFVLTRASFAGGQRYSAKWSGDNSSTWQDLRMALSMSLSTGISGQPFTGADIGGFIGSPDAELFTRWMQLGVFTPLMRAHSAWDTPNKEPWEFGKDAEDMNRFAIELRYRFLPTIYSVMATAATTGEPAMRPLFYNDARNTDPGWNNAEFLFGSDLLVAPVLEPRVARKSVWLPTGTWYDHWTDARSEGDRAITVDAPMDRLPLFVRGGAVIATRQVVQHTGEAPIDPLTLTAYPGKSEIPSVLYEDDGVTTRYQRGEFLRREMTTSLTDSSFTVRIIASTGSFVPPSRKVVVVAVDQPRPTAVRVNGSALTMSADSSSGWSYDTARRRVMVMLPDDRAWSSIDILH